MTRTAICLLLAALPQEPQGEPPPESRQPMPVPVALAVHRGAREIQVDGSLLDWPDLPPLTLTDPRQLSGTSHGAWRNADDASGVVFLLWDETSLHVAASVKDEWHRALDAKALRITEIPPADSVVLTFDTARDTRSLGPDPGREEDAEFWLAEEASNLVVRWDRLRGTARAAEEGRCVVSHDRERGITTYEARIPWREILPVGRRPEDRFVFDLQIVINDYDESTDPMPQTRIGWTFGCGLRIDPGRFGSVILVNDVASLGGRVPELPPRGRPRGEPQPAADYWDAFAERLRKAPPAVFAGEGAPEAAGGLERLRALEELERHYVTFPRVDFLEFNHRVNRRMTREIAGAVERSLPCFWFRETQRLAARADADVPDGVMRLFALPQHGWLARSQQVICAIDPAGPELAHHLGAGVDFVVVTQPLDMTRRNDQLLVRMATAEPSRPFLSHAVLHLPFVKMTDQAVVEPGRTYGPAAGTEVDALGKATSDGSVPYALGYRMRLPGGKVLLVAGPMVEPEDVSPPAGGQDPPRGCDVCLLSVRNPRAAEVGRAARAGLVVLDDAFTCQTFPGVPPVRLKDAFELQRRLLPTRSILLAPGESWDVR